MSVHEPDSREVARIEALSTVEGGDPEADAFLDRCVPGSTWIARIRTAEVSATVLSRTPLGTFSERVCTCVRLRSAARCRWNPACGSRSWRTTIRG